MKGSLGSIFGIKIVASKLCIDGLGVKKENEDLVYVSMNDYMTMKEAKTPKALKEIVDKIKILSIKPFEFKEVEVNKND